MKPKFQTIVVGERSTLDRAYIEEGLTRREQELRDKYYMLCRGVNKDGKLLTPQCASVQRSAAKKDLDMVRLLIELISHIDGDFELSDNGAAGYERLCEPMYEGRSRVSI